MGARVHVELRGLGYTAAGPLTEGAVTVQRTNRRIRKVVGTGVVGGATVTFDLVSLPAGYLDRPAGTIRVTDAAAGIDVAVEVELSEDRGKPMGDIGYVEDPSRQCIERQLVGVGPGATIRAAAGTHRGTTADGRPFLLVWEVDDGGALPDTLSLTGWRRSGAPGMGSDGNVMMWAMEVFRGDLYVATCNWRLEGQRDWEKWAFSRGPIDSSEGCEVWRLREVPADGEEAAWERVATAGLGDPYNHGIRNLKVAGEHLYAITANHTNGFELWRTSDGEDWSTVMTGGFGTVENTSGRGIATFGDHLYVGTENKDTGAEIWRAPIAAAGDVAAWERVLGDDVNRSWYAELTEFDGHLYAGSLTTHTSTADAAAEQNHAGSFVVRSKDGAEWELVVDDSFGNPENLGILSMAVFGGRLYVSTTNPNGAEVVSTTDGRTWRLDHKAEGDPQREWHAWKLYVFDGRLYVGFGRLENVWWSGFRLTSTGDGTTWITEIEPSMPANYGLRSMQAFEGRLFLGTASFPDCGSVLEARPRG